MKANRKLVHDKLKEFSQQIYILDTRISDTKMLMKQLDNPLRSSNVNGGRGGNVRMDTTSKAVELMERYENRIGDLVIKKEAIMSEFESHILGVDFVTTKIFRAKYIDGMNNKRIATALEYSLDHVQWIIGQGLDIIYNKQALHAII